MPLTVSQIHMDCSKQASLPEVVVQIHLMHAGYRYQRNFNKNLRIEINVKHRLALMSTCVFFGARAVSLVPKLGSEE